MRLLHLSRLTILNMNLIRMRFNLRLL